ncbi:MAG: transcription elongation factor subunit Spt4 [Thermoplasmata archaeon]
MRACKSCMSIFDEDIDKCKFCAGDTSKEFQGYLIIITPEKSQIANKLKIIRPGIYALRVKQ